MNARQRRQFIRSEKNDHGKRFDMLMRACGLWVTSRCPLCGAAVMIRSMHNSDVNFACPELHWKEWLKTQGARNLNVLLNNGEEFIPTFLVEAIRLEAGLRAEEELISISKRKQGAT